MKLALACIAAILGSTYAFMAPAIRSRHGRRVVGISSSPYAQQRVQQLGASSAGESQELFKAGLLANLEEEAADLASKKIRSVSDLGWKETAKRRGKTRPRHWAFGGAGEKAVQDKPNYDPANPLCVEKWLSLPDFYAIVGDDTAVADTIFVALAKGGAYVEREVAEEVISQWRPSASSSKAASSKPSMFGRGKGAASFDRAAFLKTVNNGRRDFLIGWAAFVAITGFAVSGIVFPTNPVQLALVDLLELITHSDEQMTALAAAKAASSI